ncbi:MAG TPA: cohesin domain-containing protein [Candidatus Limnocylindrales bacterium]|nr:cohesin domain-containing protein [Candidatus Limnocylindrales bacterium]
MRNCKLPLLILGCAAILLSGCPKGNDELKAGRQAEALQDYDTALVHYERALRADPTNSEYKLKAERLRFEAANFHVNQGQKLRDKGNLDQALVEFQKAAAIDPSNAIAAQEAQRTMEMIAARSQAESPAPPPSASQPKLMDGPPKLIPLSHAPISLKMTNQAKTIFETIGKLAGLTVIFDPDFLQQQTRTITVDLPNVTYTQALDIAALQSKAFWKPVTSNIIIVASEDPNKRKAFEEEIVRVFYLSNVTTDKDLTDIVTAVRNLFTPALARINPIASQNAIVIRDTPDKVMLVGRMIDALDKAKPEVVVQVSIIEVSKDRLRDLGLQPSFSGTGGIGSLTFSPPTTTSSSSSSSSSSTTPTSSGLPLNQFKHFNTGFYSATLPNVTAEAMMTDSATKIIQNPELRAVDGTKAQLRIGDRVPIATGSFGTGFGAGWTGVGASSVLSPLVNTQFQYQDVGVNVDITPRILPNRDVFLQLKVEVSSVTGNVSIGGITQPIISQRVLDDPGVRLKDGEANILGGIIERTDTNSINGYPGLAKIPILKYLFGGESIETKNDEVFIILTPHVVRMPEITAENLRSIASGTDLNPQVRLVEEVPPAPSDQSQQQPPAQATSQIMPGVAVIANGPTVTNPPPVTPTTPGAAPTLRIQPDNLTLKPGETSTIGIVVENVTDLSALPFLLQYNPAVISVEEVRHGGFLSGDSQETIVRQIDKSRGQAVISAMRPTNAPGVNGTGTVVGVVIKALAPGDSKLSIVQVNAKNSAQQPIPLITTEGTVHVQQ